MAVAMGAPESPATKRDEIAAMADDWDRITALLAGTDAMRAAGKKYLPQFPAEKDPFYADRLARSTLFNGFRQTVNTMAGKPFSEPVKFSEKTPLAIQGYGQNIDLEGRDLQTFAHEVFWTAVAYGLSHILTDYPETPAGLTMAQQKQAGVRPYFTHVKPTQIKGWRSERVGGAETLTQLRICEYVTLPVGQWGVQTIEQIRVLAPDHFEIWRQNANNVWVLFETGPVSLGAIPLTTVYTGRTGFMTAQPMLNDVAHLNIKHWQIDSDLSALLHVASVPILFAAGFEDSEDIIAGAQKAVSSNDATAKLSYVEHDGHAIGSGRQQLQDIEDRMRALGANLLVRNQSGNRTTATEKSIDSAEADSALSIAALSLQASLNEALGYMARWEGLPEGAAVTVYTDFNEVSNDTAKGDLLMKGKGEGCWSAQTVFEEAQALGVISDHRTWDMELARIALEGPAQGIIGNFEQPPSSTVINLHGVNPDGAKTTSIKSQPDGSYVISDGKRQRTARKQTDGSYAIEG